MVDTRNMVLKRNTWFAKIGIPKEVRHVFKGKTSFVKTTGESDPREAYKVAAPMLALWRDEIAMARQNMPSGLMDEWISHARRWCELFPNIPYDVVPEDPNEERPPVAWLVGFINYLPSEAYDLLAFRTMPQIEQQQSWRGVPAVLTTEWADKQLAKAGVSTPFLRHLDHFKQHTDMRGKNLKQAVPTLREFATEADQPIEQLSGAHVQGWLFGMLNKKTGELADKGTRQRKLYELRKYWEHLTAMGWVPDDKANPFLGRKVANKETRSEAFNRQRLGFPPEDIPALWKQAEADGDTSLAAVIKLSAYSGARLGEVMDLQRDHIATYDGIRCINIVIGKSPRATRLFPIHPDILDFVDALEKNADKHGHLIHSSAHHRAPAMSQRFGRMKTRLGYGPLHTEHSIRHTVI